jgi:hypothetical protein
MRWWLWLGVASLAVAASIMGAVYHDDFQPDARDARRSASLGHSTPRPTVSEAALQATLGHCGPATATAIASVDLKVARRIYTGELRGSEVSANAARVSGDSELRKALAGSDEAGVYAAVHRLVYTPHWHIVRLRVVKNGRVIADVGGPYVVAPVSGPLKWHGRTLGSYVMSVQDDAGYMKLVSHFVGVPIDLYVSAAFVMGTLQPPPPSWSDDQSATLAGHTYQTHVLSALAFPTGTLHATLFVPKPTNAMTRLSCAAVQVATWGTIAKHIAARFTPLSAHYSDFAGTLKGSSAGLVYVRVGSKQLAGGYAGPRRIPRVGTVKYRGRSWRVFSWEPSPPARIYFLTPSA